ncbi:Rho GTPase activating protein, partial [Linderina macrospora]
RRYYVCKSNQPVLEYFETPGGSPIGSINLRGAVVKTGRTPSESTPTLRSKSNQKESDIFRHAFLIEELPKRAGKERIAHPLWADSDRERDEWVAALRYVTVRDAEGPQRANDEVAKYAVLLNGKNDKLPMIQQIQTSITHEQGARRSLEYNRMRQEQRQIPDGAVGKNAVTSLQRRPSTARANMGSAGSPLTNQVWPATSSMGDMDRYISNGAGKDYADIKNTGVTHPLNLGPPGALEPPPPHLPVDARPRSLSFPPNEGRHISTDDRDDCDGAGKAAQHTVAKPSPQEIAARLSASFAEFSTPSSEQKKDRHLSPIADDSVSEQYTIDSSMYSTSRENDARNGLSIMSSHPTIDNRESVLSLPDSFTSPHDVDNERASMVMSPGLNGVSGPPATAPPTTLTFQGLGS